MNAELILSMLSNQEATIIELQKQLQAAQQRIQQLEAQQPQDESVM